MLTTTQKRYIDIFGYVVKTGFSAEEAARQLGIAAITAHRAVRWCHDRGLHILDTKDKLQTHLWELGAALRMAERFARISDKRSRRLIRLGKEAGGRAWAKVGLLALDRVKEIRTRIMELEGIYKHVLNIQHGGEIKVRGEPDLSRLKDDELDQLEQLTRRTIASNN